MRMRASPLVVFVLFGIGSVFTCSSVRAQCSPSIENGNAQPLDIQIAAQAATAATSLPDDFDKVDIYEGIGRILWKEGDAIRGASFFDCAMRVAANSLRETHPEEISFRSTFDLTVLNSDRARAGDPSGALGHVKDFSDADLRNMAVRDVVAAEGQLEKFQFGEQLARSIVDTDTRDAAFDDLAMRARCAGQFEFSEKMAHAIQNGVDRVKGLADLALALCEEECDAHAAALFAEAIRVAETLPANDAGLHNVGALHGWGIFYSTRDEMLGYVAVRQALAGDSGGSDVTVSKIASFNERSETKHVIAVNGSRGYSPEQTSDGDENSAPDEASEPFVDPFERSIQLAQKGDYFGALALSGEVDPVVRGRFFANIGEIQAENGEARQALQWANRLETPVKVTTLIAIAEALANDHSARPN